MDQPIFTYWKFLTLTYYTGKAALSPVTVLPLRPWVLRLFGARIGSDVAIDGVVDTPFLTTIGDRTLVGNGSHLAGNVTQNGALIIGRVQIGSDVTICMNAVVLPNTIIGDRAVVDIGAVVMPGSVIPAGETWRGNPARKWLGASV